MCRLFGLAAGRNRVTATFWLLDAPDSVEAQSRRNADGSGIGFFDSADAPVLDKQPEPAFRDPEFIREAKHAESSAFVAHVRWATAGGRTVRNTHPFAMRGRVMAHNGGIGELPRLEAELGDYVGLVLGDTDSERYFALITRQIEAHDGDVGAGIAAAAGWIAANLPVSSLNAVVAAPGELWALRYPGQHALHVLNRPAELGQHPSRPAGLHVRSATSSIHVPALDSAASVVVASEQLDGETNWRMLAPGELVHVRSDLSVESAVIFTQPPARLVPISNKTANIDT
jgi:predicted glutamine amidotransferase